MITTSKELILKVLVLGAYGVGKTAILQNLTKTPPVEGSGLKLGVNFSDYEVTIGIREVKFQFWEFVGKQPYM